MTASENKTGSIDPTHSDCETDPLFDGPTPFGAIEEQFVRRYGRDTEGRTVRPTFQAEPDQK